MIATKKVLDETDRKIIGKLKSGLSVKQVAYALNLKHRNVSYRIGEMKRYYKCTSLSQLVVTLKK